jgi:hypothetical protein
MYNEVRENSFLVYKYLTPLLLALRLFFIMLPPSFRATLSRPTASASHKDGLARTHTLTTKSISQRFGSCVRAPAHLARKWVRHNIGFAW